MRNFARFVALIASVYSLQCFGDTCTMSVFTPGKLVVFEAKKVGSVTNVSRSLEGNISVKRWTNEEFDQLRSKILRQNGETKATSCEGKLELICDGSSVRRTCLGAKEDKKLVSILNEVNAVFSKSAK